MRYYLKILKCLPVFLVLAIVSGCVQKKPAETNEYYDRGAEVVDATFSALSKQLQSALAEGGVKNAVEYCNFIVNPVIDSLSRQYNAEIRRVTLKTRNVLNKPRDYENIMLRAYLDNYDEGRLLKPIVENLYDGNHVYYSPIIIKSGLCLACHGEIGTNITQKDYDYIRSLYPTDKATGYSEGDMRGVWAIVLYD